MVNPRTKLDEDPLQGAGTTELNDTRRTCSLEWDDTKSFYLTGLTYFWLHAYNNESMKMKEISPCCFKESRRRNSRTLLLLFD